MKSPDSLWWDIIIRFSQQSRCLSRQVGAIIVKDSCMIAEGWNSPPKGSCARDCTRLRCIGSGEAGSAKEEMLCVHAEANAIASCAKRGTATEGSSIYTTTFPCMSCTQLIISAGIKEVAYIEDYANNVGRDLLYNANICIRKLTKENE